MTYMPRVLIAPAKPGTVRKVGCLEIPADRAERIGADPLPPLDVELVALKRTPDGRLLCYRSNRPTRGTGCSGCALSGHQAGCPAAFKAAYNHAPPAQRPKSRPRKPAIPLTPEQKAERRNRIRAARRRYAEKHRIDTASPEQAEKIRARWRAKKRRQAQRRKLALAVPPDESQDA